MGAFARMFVAVIIAAVLGRGRGGGGGSGCRT